MLNQYFWNRYLNVKLLVSNIAITQQCPLLDKQTPDCDHQWTETTCDYLIILATEFTQYENIVKSGMSYIIMGKSLIKGKVVCEL